MLHNASGGWWTEFRFIYLLGRTTLEIQPTPHPWGPSRTKAQWPGVKLAHQGLACWLPSSPYHSSLPYRRCLRSLPNKLLELKYFSQHGLFEETVYRDFQPGVCPKDILLNLIEKKILFRRPTSLLHTCPCPSVITQGRWWTWWALHSRHLSTTGAREQGSTPGGESHSLPGKGFSPKWAQAMTGSAVTVIISLPWQRKPTSESWTGFITQWILSFSFSFRKISFSL